MKGMYVIPSAVEGSPQEGVRWGFLDSLTLARNDRK